MQISEENCLNLLDIIKEKMLTVCGHDFEIPVYFDDLSFVEKNRSMEHREVIINCIFMNSELKLFADIYRKSAEGCVDFFCGKAIDDLDEFGLGEIAYALKKGKYFVSEERKEPIVRVKKKNVTSMLSSLLRLKGMMRHSYGGK